MRLEVKRENREVMLYDIKRAPEIVLGYKKEEEYTYVKVYLYPEDVSLWKSVQLCRQKQNLFANLDLGGDRLPRGAVIIVKKDKLNQQEAEACKRICEEFKREEYYDGRAIHVVIIGSRKWNKKIQGMLAPIHVCEDESEAIAFLLQEKKSSCNLWLNELLESRGQKF